jgi:enamine deaminase RidA (YjgF/YER057c/UK114 family)
VKKTLFTVTAVFFMSSAFADEVRTLIPDTVPVPFKDRFSHGKIVPANAEWLFTAGQTGRRIDGSIGVGIEEQADLALQNLYNIVVAAGMSSDDVIKMTIYYRDPKDLSAIIAARNKHFGDDFKPTSTAVGVSALANPAYLLEVELVAAKVPETSR